MANNKRNSWAGILIGPAVTFFALVALWKNETRFNFYAAANSTTAVQDIDDASDGQLMSFTGPMDRELTIPGEYVEKLTGYLKVLRQAEIYAWDKHKDSDDRVTWERKWMSSLESNSRNNGIRQTLSSKTFLPDSYQVGKLNVQVDKIEFVDATKRLDLNQLELVKNELVNEGDYFYLRKSGSDSAAVVISDSQPNSAAGSISGQQIGDERIRYRGIPVPDTASYFGKYQSGRAVADTSNQRTGWINLMIQDTGVLHHLVAGDREQALSTMKAYFGRLKWIVRVAGTVASVVGILILFSSIFGFLYGIPLIGRVAEAGAFLFALVIGIPLAILTIAVAYLFANPLVLLGIGAVVAAVLFVLRARSKKVQTGLKDQLNQRYGHTVEDSELKEIEFVELAQFALADGKIDENESKFLHQWAKKHRWSDHKYETMLAKAKAELPASVADTTSDDRLSNLIRLALADGEVSLYELKTIRSAAKNAGYDEAAIRDLTDQVRASATG